MRPETIIDEPRQFDPKSFFYSRTDRRGVIRCGNPSFFDVAGYAAADLMGAPHKIVRHPDMPRGFFYFMWEQLKAGRPVVGFVKNLAQDGRYYWVLALVMPLDDGFLSVRQGAAGALFQKTQALYARMLQAEAEGIDPGQSAAMMLRELAALGFADFRDYMFALCAEQLSEDRLAWFARLRDALKEVFGARVALLDTLRTLYLIPTNMRILASRLEPSGGPVSAISDCYKRAATELMDRLQTSQNAETGEDDGMTLVSEALIALILSEMVGRAVSQFGRETAVDGVDADEEMRLLVPLLATLRDKAGSRTDLMLRGVTHIAEEAETITRLMAGLDQIRILGEVESGRMRNSDNGLAAIMTQLGSFHGVIHTRLSAMSHVAARMQNVGVRWADTQAC